MSLDDKNKYEQLQKILRDSKISIPDQNALIDYISKTQKIMDNAKDNPSSKCLMFKTYLKYFEKKYNKKILTPGSPEYDEMWSQIEKNMQLETKD